MTNWSSSREIVASINEAYFMTSQVIRLFSVKNESNSLSIWITYAWRGSATSSIVFQGTDGPIITGIPSQMMPALFQAISSRVWPKIS